MVVFTGGEATLRWGDLLRSIERAKGHGLRTRLVTNGWWAFSECAALDRLKKLRDAGLDEINFSTGDEHSKFITLRTLIEGIASSVECGFLPVVMMEVTASSKLTRKKLIESALYNERLGEHVSQVRFLESPWMPLDAAIVETYPDGLASNRDNLSRKTGCDSIFGTYTVQANGRVGICCGLGMQTVDALQPETFDPEQTSFLSMQAKGETDIVKLLIRQLGPEKVLDRASRFDPTIKWENMYAHKCQSCLRVFNDPSVLNALRENESELLVELAASIAFDRILSVEELH